MQDINNHFSKELVIIKKNQVETLEIKNKTEIHASGNDQSEKRLSELEDKNIVVDPLFIDTPKTINHNNLI